MKDSAMRGPHSGAHDIIRVILQRKWIVLVTLLISVAIAAGMAAFQSRRYTATSAIALDARKIQAVPQDVVVSRLSQESPFLRTEIDVITSRALAEEVMKNVDADLLSQGLSRSTFMQQTLFGMFGSSKNVIISADTPDLKIKRSVDFLLSGLRVDNDGRSYTVFISFADENPVLAAQVANAYANAYLEHLAAIQKSATREVSQWLAERLNELGTALETSERAVQSFRQSAELVEANGMTLQGNRLNALNLQLIQARSERAGAEARIETAQKYRASEKGADAFSDVLKSPVIQSLKQQEAQVSRAIQDLESSGATQSSQLSSLKIQQASLQQQMDHEIKQIVESLASEVEVMLRREKDIEQAIADTWEKTAQESRDLVKLQQLQREANANRAIYESFLNRYKQTIEQEGFVAPEARLISKAEIPSRASGRNVIALFVFALMGGSVAGTGLAFAVDRLDRRVRSGRHLEELTGTPVIGRIPVLFEAKRLKPQDQVVTVPRSIYSEATRRLAVALHRSQFLSEAKVVLVTSAERGEGKSTTCVSLARTLAMSGRKVIVVDADLHRPSVAGSFGQSQKPDLNDYLSGVRSLSELVRIDERSGAHFIAAGPTQEQPQDIFQGQMFKDLIQGLRSCYDIVIIDSPPVSAAVDAAILGNHADAVLLVVRWGSTSDTAVLSTLDELNLLATPVSGIILNGVRTQNNSYEPRYELMEHPISVPVRRQYALLTELGSRSRGKLRTMNGAKMKKVANDHLSAPPL